jgi:hypothetical protein
MKKNLLIGLLALVIVLGGFYFVHKNSRNDEKQEMAPPRAAGPNAKGGRQMMVGKGTNLKKSPLFAYAYQVYPEKMSEDTTKAIAGFSVKAETQEDGSAVVTFMPKDDEYQKQVYTVKKGMTLYFIEQTPLDDKNDQDKDLNYRDDYGLITNSDGVVQ